MFWPRIFLYVAIDTAARRVRRKSEPLRNNSLGYRHFGNPETQVTAVDRAGMAAEDTALRDREQRAGGGGAEADAEDRVQDGEHDVSTQGPGRQRSARRGRTASSRSSAAAASSLDA